MTTATAGVEAIPKRKVAVLGAGSWGTTFAKVLADGGSDVVIWARRSELAREITQSKRNSDYLPGINLPRGLWATSRLPEVLDGAEQVYLSVPSQSLRENLLIVRDLIPKNAIVISLMKGVERGSGKRMSEVIREELRIGPDRIAVVSGPNLALEIAKEQPTASVVSSEVPRNGDHRRHDRDLPLPAIARQHGRHRHRIRRRAQEPHRRRHRHRRRRRLRREHQGLDHHPRSRRDDRLRRRPTAVAPRPSPGSRASATSSRRASRRCRATTPRVACSVRATATPR